MSKRDGFHHYLTLRGIQTAHFPFYRNGAVHCRILPVCCQAQAPDQDRPPPQRRQMPCLSSTGSPP